MSTRFRAPAAAGRPRLPQWAGLAAGAVLVASVFLPWYALNIAPPFSAGTASGWSATVFAKIAMALGVVTALASAAQLADEHGFIALEHTQRIALAWAAMAAALPAAGLVAFRLVVLPDPADLLSRQIGIYVAMAAAVAAVLAALGQIATQDDRTMTRRRR